MSATTGTSTERKAFANRAINQSSNIKLYPNPSDGSVTFEMGSDLSYNITVYNVLGEKVFESSISNKQTVNLNHLSSATYIVHIHNNGCYLKTERISIVH